MVKMIVTSFYNCLINEEDAIPTSTVLSILKLKENKIKLAICTNRTYKEILEYNRDFPFVDYIVSLNGSYIMDVSKNTVISKNKIPLTTIKRLSKILNKYECIYYTIDNTYTDLDKIKGDIYKIEIKYSDDVITDLDKLNVQYTIFNYQNEKYIEIISNKCSMFKGVDKISLLNGFLLDELLVIGSNESDYSLIKNINNSYIVENSDSLLKNQKFRLTSSNKDKGVEKVINGVI